MTSQDQRPSALASNRVPSFTGLKPLILPKTSSSSDPKQETHKTYVNNTRRSKKSNSGVLGYGGSKGLGVTSNIQSQGRSTSARQPRNQMIISYQITPEIDSTLGWGISPSTLQLSFSSPNRRSRSETFQFPLPPSFNLDNQILPFSNNQDRHRSSGFSTSSDSSSRESSPELRPKNHHRREAMIAQSWKDDIQSWINEKSPSDLNNGMDWSEFGQEKERIRLHLEAQAQLGGRQGWSPETESSCSETFPSHPIGLGFESEDSQSVTAPLFSKKAKPLKHRDSQDTVASSIRSWAFSTAAASSSSDSGEKISLAPPSYSSNPGTVNESLSGPQPQGVRRRSRSNSTLPPAYPADESSCDSPKEEAQEYPFPLMDQDFATQESNQLGDEEDEVKLRRLNESFLLLGQPSNEDLGEADDQEVKDAQLPHEGLGNLSPFDNPFALKFDTNREFTAPSLAEQMAYACGSGMGYLSVDEGEELGWEARAVRSRLNQAQEIQSLEEEDVHQFDEERAEVGSSWSGHGEGIESWDQVESEDELFWRSNQASQEMSRRASAQSSSGHYRLGQGLGRSGALRRNPTSASLRTFSVLSGSSTAASSPILSGVLAAPRPRAVTCGYQGERSPVDIDSLFSKPLSIEIEQGESFGSEEISQVQTEAVDSQNEQDAGLLSDFAYLLDHSISDFRAPEIEGLQTSKTVPAGLNTIIQPSPALSTPALGLLQTPEMLSSLASPLPKGNRQIEGLPSLSSCPAFPFQSPSPSAPHQAEVAAESGMPSSISTSSNLSVLDRPRPFSRESSGVEYIQIQKKVKKPTPSLLSRTADSPSSSSPGGASTSRLLPSTSSPDIPIRRSSLEERKSEVVVESSISHNSPTFYFEESRKALVEEDAKLKLDLEELVNMRRKSQAQSSVPAPLPSPSVANSSSSKATSSGRKGMLRNKLSVAALRGLVSSEKEVKKPAVSVAMKVSKSSDSNATTSSSGKSSSSSSSSSSISASRPKSILSSSASSKAPTSRSSQPVIKGSELDAIKRSCADKAAFIRAAAIKAQHQPNYAESVHSSSSSSSASSRPSIQSSRSNVSKSSNSSVSSSLSLPTLCVARTPSQRQRGETGLPETTQSRFSSNDDNEMLKKRLNSDGKGVTVGLTRTKSGRVKEFKVENDPRLPSRVKEFKQARRISQVKALVHGKPGEERTLPMPPPQKGVLILEENSKEVVQVMVNF